MFTCFECDYTICVTCAADSKVREAMQLRKIAMAYFDLVVRKSSARCRVRGESLVCKATYEEFLREPHEKCTEWVLLRLNDLRPNLLASVLVKISDNQGWNYWFTRDRWRFVVEQVIENSEREGSCSEASSDAD